mgnify:CR=1 FL=1
MWVSLMVVKRDVDILFISSRGSQYRYYQALSAVNYFSSLVVTLFPGLGFKVFNTGLSLSLIKQGIDFHLKRKQRKYGGVKPVGAVWWAYVFFSACYFSVIYLKFKYVFSKNTPKVVCMWNGHRLPEMAIRAASKGHEIRIAYFENGLLPQTTTLDFSGVNAFSSIPRAAEFYERYSQNNDCRSLVSTSLLSRKPHKYKTEISGSMGGVGRYIFIPFQVNFDSQVIINSPWLNSMESFYSMLLSVVDLIDSELTFVIKEHPSDPRVYKECYVGHSRIKFVASDTEGLIRGAEAIITLNSSVGIEAAMLERKVVVLGNACYAIDGIMQVAQTEVELVDIINDIHNWSPNIETTRAFFSYLKADYLLPGSWQDQIKGVEVGHRVCFENKIKAVVSWGGVLDLSN